MKRNIYNTIWTGLVVALLLAVAGCNDVMDTEPFDRFGENVVWSNRTNADAFMFSTYNDIVSSGNNYIEFVNTEQWTPNSININGNEDTRENFDRSEDFGFDRFGQIRRCNLAIERVQESESMPETDKKELIAEAKFLRAMVYYGLARKFGIVVWIDRVLTTDDEFELPTTPDAKTTYGYIIKDLEDAIPDMPEETPAGRANRYAAYALLTRVCLQAAAYTGDASLYQKAIDAADVVINSGKYTLETDYEGMFNEAKPTSGEIIFAKYRSSINTNCNDIADLQNVVPNANNDRVTATGASPYFIVDRIFEAWLSWSPSQDLINEYEVIDQATGQAVDWNRSSQFLASVAQDEASGIVKQAGHVTDDSRVNELMYYHRDKRFYASIVYDSCIWFGETVTTCERGNLHRMLEGSLGHHKSLTGYYWRKGVYNVTPRVFVGERTDYHWVVFRLGEMYLNKAEALLRLGKTAEAVAAFNQTRTVHGGMPASQAASSADAWKAYKRERRVDMAKEGDYYWSLLRWGKYGGDANYGAQPGAKIPELVTAPTFIEISKDRKTYRIEEITHQQNNVRIFDETRRYLFPIPHGQRERNPNLAQNPGW
jgi:tetratricopeptide (TPR) repeat protein